jgi:AcrR family transcriptional regulator
MTKVSKKSADPRVLRTRTLLREALFALLEKKHFDSITVLQIAEKAGLNPATFYLHYEDKWDLLNSVVAEVGSIIDQQPHIAFLVETTETGSANVLELTLFEHIERHRDFYRLMLGKRGVASVRYELQNQIQKAVRVILEQLPHSIGGVDVPDDLVEHYFAGAYIAVIQWWVDSPDPVSPRQLAEWLENLSRSTSSSEFMALFKKVE